MDRQQEMFRGTMASSATFSPCEQYRYLLSREWDLVKPAVAFIGLNPSTADETADDPTVRRCINYAKGWGFGALRMLNIFAFRATDPKVMKAEHYPVGPSNDLHIESVAREVSMIVCAWGGHGGHRCRDLDVIKLLSGFDLKCLSITKGGRPGHPLYLRKDLELLSFRTAKVGK